MGSEVSVVPPSKDSCPDCQPLVAANGTPIRTFGFRRIQLDLSLDRIFDWVFTVANVPHPILGGDFLHKFRLVPYVTEVTLIDMTTNNSTSGLTEPPIRH